MSRGAHTSAAVLVLVAAWAIPSAQAPDREDPGYIGALFSQETLDLDPSFEGRLIEMLVRTGDVVRRGDLLARLDDRTLRQEKAQAEADLQEAGAAAERASTELSLAEDGNRRRARTPTNYSEEELNRAREEVAMARSALRVAEAKVHQKEALVAQLEQKLSQSRLTAPFDGTISRTSATAGQMVGPGEPVLRLIGSDELWVRFAVPPEELAGVAIGTRIRAYNASLGFSISGAVERIFSEIDWASGMVFCEASVERPESRDGPPPPPGLAVRVVPASR